MDENLSLNEDNKINYNLGRNQADIEQIEICVAPLRPTLRETPTPVVTRAQSSPLSIASAKHIVSCSSNCQTEEVFSNYAKGRHSSISVTTQMLAKLQDGEMENKLMNCKNSFNRKSLKQNYI